MSSQIEVRRRWLRAMTEAVRLLDRLRESGWSHDDVLEIGIDVIEAIERVADAALVGHPVTDVDRDIADAERAIEALRRALTREFATQERIVDA